jgi:uncharacterized peroxidase-related enzyme
MEGGIVMTRIQPLDPDRVVGESEALLTALRGELGFVPSLMRLLAHSPTALAGYLGLRASLKGGTLATPLRERIAIAVAAMNECDPCLASHMRFGRDAGLSEDELYAAGQWRSADPAAAAALDFARALIETCGRVDDATLAAIRESGFADAEIIEVVATVAANLFANLVNNLARPESDSCGVSPPG